jgi:Holliday junction resolvasome RuvABC ATP-dependent DNA helicase subunit
MFLKEFNTSPATKVAKINKVLQEQFGITVKTNFPSKKKLKKVLENATSKAIPTITKKTPTIMARILKKV